MKELRMSTSMHGVPAAAVLLGLGLALISANASAPPVVVKAADARIREQGNIQDNGAFSFWTRGVLGDWFVAPEDGEVVLEIVATGRPFGGQGPIFAADVIPLDGAPTEVGRIEVQGGGYKAYSLGFYVRAGFFTVRLRHTNRVAQQDPEELRHLTVTELRVQGARLAERGPAAYAFFGDGAAVAQAAPAARPLFEGGGLSLYRDAQSGKWSVHREADGLRVDGIHPVFGIADLPVDLTATNALTTRGPVADERFGDCWRIQTGWRRRGGLTVEQTLLVNPAGEFIVAQVDFTNETGRDLIVNRMAPMVADSVVLGGSNAEWRAESDGKRFCDPHQIVTVAEAGEFEGWWHLCARSRDAGTAVLFGSLTNDKGIGRTLMVPDGDSAMKVAAWSDYEGVVMPAGTRITGEPCLLVLGRTGLDCLERFGSLVAAANGVDLMRDHPIDPYDPTSLSIFNTFNSYGAGVISGFPYKHDRSRGEQAFMDRQWSQANSTMVGQLGLREYGYSPPRSRRIRGTPSPLARRYGNPDWWFKEAREMADAHPEHYVDGNIDFSNPSVVEFEKQRAAQAFADPDAIITYGVDFTDVWRRLPGQYDPTQTSAQTYRTAMGIWRDLAKAHPAGGYARIYMNIIGFNYDIVDILRIGGDSDQAFYGRPCTFEQDLVRQASGRWFYNGKVWWDNPDSFHVYAGGIYSYAQAKTHASFCSLAGNVLMIGEPFTDEDLPPERLDIARRVAPMTPDTAVAVDMFEHNPARLWNMRIERPFGAWNVVGLFNTDYGQTGEPITQRIDFRELGLDPAGEYLVYEFWRKEFLGAVKGGFTRTLQAPDCEVYAIVQAQEHPVLISTNRHVRQMAYDVLDLAWGDAARTLSGMSRVVGGDPYQLRICVPDGFTARSAQAGNLAAALAEDDGLLTLEFTSPAAADVHWSVTFD
jgi:hypothetical protein